MNYLNSNHLIKLLLLLSTIFFATAAQAGDRGSYIGVGVGSFTSDFGFNVKAKAATGYYINLGVDINDYLGFETRWGSISAKKVDSTVNPTTYKVSLFTTLLVKGQYPLLTNAKVFVLAGTTSLQGSFNDGFVSRSIKKVSFSYGGGLAYQIADTLDLNLEYMAYFPQSSSSAVGNTIYISEPSLVSIAFNAVYKF